MVLNNIEKDVKILSVKAEKTQSQISKEIGSTTQYVNRVIKKKSLLNETFVKIVDACGYDIELNYVPKKEVE